MGGSLDLPMRDLASALIGALGFSGATLVRTTGDSGYDVKTGEDLMPSGVTSYPIAVTPPEGFKRQEIDGSAVQKTDLRCYIAAKDVAVVPTPRTDTLTLGGTVYNIIRVQTIYSGNLPCLFELQLRI